MATVYIGIGSNIDAEANLKACADRLRQAFPDIRFASVYSTAARDEEDQADFLNTVASFETEATPEELAAKLQAIEQGLKKDPPYAKGPRTIDLDILLYDDVELHTSELTIPHPRMLQRRFVLEPLCELNSAYTEVLQKTLDQACEKLEFNL